MAHVRVPATSSSANSTVIRLELVVVSGGFVSLPRYSYIDQCVARKLPAVCKRCTCAQGTDNGGAFTI